MKFTSVEEVSAMGEPIKAYIQQATEIEKAGLKINFQRDSEPILAELTKKFAEDPRFKSAFEALTPGRQRGYFLFCPQTT